MTIYSALTQHITIDISVYSACTSACEAVSMDCASIFKVAGQTALLPNCSTEITSTGYGLQADDNCNSIPTKCKCAFCNTGINKTETNLFLLQ